MPRPLLAPVSLALALLAVLLSYLPAAERWPEVPDADFAKFTVGDFADHELEVPYHLHHFARIANAVVEQGEHRGFLDLAVNRDPKDNKPYNARIQEMQMVLAYFYGTDRPWNPYHAHPAVRVRLEAMLGRWSRIQNPDGLFAEYSPTNYSLAPTNFGAMAAAQALEILHESRAPFDPAIAAAARASLRSALLAMFNRADMRRHARDWSNQFSGAYFAALAFLRVGADAEVAAALAAALAHATAEDQSPAGFHYEQGGPDFGYSGVHDNNLRVAWPLLRDRPELTRPLLASEARWNRWLAHNFVLQPGGSSAPLFVVNAGINTRTSHAFQTPRSRPLAELVSESRPFATTDAEHRAGLVARRAALARDWGAWPALLVPNAYAYLPPFVYGAWRPLDTWHLPAAERERALASLPWRVEQRFNRQFHDAWPLTVTFARRPAYYAAFNSGRPRVPRQHLGLGLLWNERYGVALQSVAGTPWAAGIRPLGAERLHEQTGVNARFKVGSHTIVPRPGEQTLRPDDLRITYPLGDAGEQTLIFTESRILVEIRHRGEFETSLPLLIPADARAEESPGRVRLRRDDGSSFLIEIHEPASLVAFGAEEPVEGALNRRFLLIRSRDSLRFSLSFP